MTALSRLLMAHRLDIVWWIGLGAVSAGAWSYDWRLGLIVGGMLCMATVTLAVGIAAGRGT